MLDGQIIVRLSAPWDVGATHIIAGSLASFDAAAAAQDPAHLAPVAIYQPGPRESLEDAGATRDALFVAVNQNVRGRMFEFSRQPDGSWTSRQLSFPDNLALGVAATNLRGSEAFVDVEGFLTPRSVWLADARTGSVAKVKSAGAELD